MFEKAMLHVSTVFRVTNCTVPGYLGNKFVGYRIGIQDTIASLIVVRGPEPLVYSHNPAG